MLRPALRGIIASAILLWASAAHAGIDSKIRKIEQEITKSNTEFSSITEAINKLSLEIDRLNEEKESASAKIDGVASDIRSLTAQINSLNNDYKTRRDNLNALIAEVEQTSVLAKKSRRFADENTAVIKKLSSAAGDQETMLMHDFEEGSALRMKSFIMGDLVTKVRDFAASCSEKQLKLDSERKAVEKKIEDLEAALGEFSSKVSSSKRIQMSHQRSLEKIRRQQENLHKELREKEKSRKEIDRLLETFAERKKDLMAEKEKEKEIEALRGKIPWPVDGRMAGAFGRQKHPLLDTYTISRGIKIEASENDVKSVRAGTVSFAGYFKGYGKTVIIEHGGGFYTVTAGLDDIDVSKDEAVQAYSRIGGIAPGESLYFEIRRGSVPEDPALWLLKK